MTIHEIKTQLDQLYTIDLQQAYSFMMEQAMIAMNEQNDDVLLFILNELMGYYRVTSSYQEGNVIANKLLNLIESYGLQETLTGATSYLNVATFYRVQNRFDEAHALYQRTQDIYNQLLDSHDPLMAAFYNNYSLLFMAQNDIKNAILLSNRALDIIKQSHNDIDIATNEINVAQMYMSMHQYDQAKELIDESIALFEKENSQSGHYYLALATLGQYYDCIKDYQKALELYDDALIGVEKAYGQAKDYQAIQEQQQATIRKMKQYKGLDICQKYYETYGKDMLEKEFKAYMPYMAIGMFGFGSECLGYDDDISQDHDYGGGFCILLPDDIYNEIGETLQDAYDQLPKTFMGLKRITSSRSVGRVGVFSTTKYYQSLLGHMPRTLDEWLDINEQALLVSSNGRLFDDYYGEVTKIREYLSFYPEDVCLKKIIRAVAKISQSGQYNYARCMKRHDVVAAQLALDEFIQQTMSFIYHINKKYMPYYKWSFHGLKDCHILGDLQDDLKQLVLLPDQSQVWNDSVSLINIDDQKVVLIEKICQRIVEELNRLGLIQSDDVFLENHVDVMTSHLQSIEMKRRHIMEG